MTNSFPMAPIAAKQGAQSRLNTRKEYAARRLIPSKSSTPNTPTTSSLATSPIMVATVALILPNPNGAKIQQSELPTMPSTLLSRSISALKEKVLFTIPKRELAQITIEESSIMVPAFFTNDHTRSHMERSAFSTVGQWYAGNSITKGARSSANFLVFSA